MNPENPLSFCTERRFVGCSVLTTPFCLGRRLVCIVEIASSYLLAMTKGVRFVGWISEAHPPPKATASFCTHRKLQRHSAPSKKTLRHSARSEAELQNLKKNRQNKFSSELQDSATARRMTGFFLSFHLS